MTTSSLKRRKSSTDAASVYVDALIGRPWSRSGLHCWRLVCDVQRDLFGRELPAVMRRAPPGAKGRQVKAAAFGGHAERARWTEVAPTHGAVVLMHERGGNPATIVHAGVYLAIDGGGVLHVDDPHGVVFDPLPILAARGWDVIYLVPKES